MKIRYWDLKDPDTEEADREALVVSRGDDGGFVFAHTIHGRQEHNTGSIFLDAEQTLHLAERIFEEFKLISPQGLKYEDMEK